MQTTGSLQPDHSEWLQRESGLWVREGLIKDEQRQWLLARYGLVQGENAASLKRIGIVQILAVMGAVLTGIGVLVLVGANWDDIPRYGRLALIVLGSLAAYLTGWRLAYEPGERPAVGQAILLLGSLIWIAGIFLVGQMFHIGSPDDRENAMGLLYGALGVLPLAYVLKSSLQLGLGLILLTAWSAIAAQDRYHLEQGFAAAALGASALMYGLALLSRRLGPKGFSHVYGSLAAVLGLGSLYVMAFHDFWRSLRWEYATNVGPAWQVALALAGAGIAAASLARFIRGDGDVPETGELGLDGFIGILAVAAGFALTHRGPGGDVLPVVVANLALFAGEITVVWMGWKRLRGGLVNLGLATFFIHVMTRYFDLLYGMLNSGFVFIGAGLLLLAMGWLLERQRRYLLGSMAERSA